ncbi:hypothetical protein NX059_004361 [Plenodomus lindquistii]|nr:hypothetical protein NX059_004361 [Plenodomus lindquistii]
MAQVLIFGSGSIGVVHGMFLSKGGANVTCVCRSNYDVAKAHGFTVRSTIFGEHHYQPKVVRSVEDAVEALPPNTGFDFVVICTKAISNREGPSIPDLIRPCIRESHTSIAIIQNGLNVENIYRNSFPNNTIISAVAYLPTSPIEPCIFSHTETQKLHIGPFPAHTATEIDRTHTDAFAKLMTLGGAEAIVHADVQIQRWKKLIGNATWNPICALSLSRDLQFLNDTPGLAQDFVRAAMREVVSVAHALGYGEHISEDDVAMQVRRSEARVWPGVEPSMLADARGQRPMEVEAIIGAVVKVAREKGVDVPRLETLFLLLNSLDRSFTR